jgi:flagellar assembly protein FliH
LILEEATLSYNRSIKFPKQPTGFKVSKIGLPPISLDESEKKSLSEYERGKMEASSFYQAEISQLKSNYASLQDQILTGINSKTEEVLAKLDHKLPDLVIGLAERVLGQIDLDRDAIEKIVKSMVSDFSGDNEKLEVYLCPQDLTLLKALSKQQDALVQETESEQDQEEGFASAIAGIFDGLDGDDELLDGYPNVKFFEDSSLNSGDCQIKSRFGLLDGRISTKLRKIEEELKRND